MKFSSSQITSKHRLISLKRMALFKMSFHLFIISSLPVPHSTHCRLPLSTYYESVFCLIQQAFLSTGHMSSSTSNGLHVCFFLNICALLFHDILPELSLIPPYIFVLKPCFSNNLKWSNSLFSPISVEVKFTLALFKELQNFLNCDLLL